MRLLRILPTAFILSQLLCVALAQDAQTAAALRSIASNWTGLPWPGSCPGQCLDWPYIRWSPTNQTVIAMNIPTSIQLTPNLPSTWAQDVFSLPQLQELDLYDRNIGCIPSEIALLTRLQLISIRTSAGLSGCPWTLLPSSVTKLIFSYNHMKGTFPSQLPSLVNLEQLDLLGNDFQPPLPVRSVLKRHSPGQDLSLLSNLSLVALVGQAPTETMPAWIRSGKFQSIYVVSLFKGFLPLISTPALTSLVLAKSDFSGQPFPPITELTGGQATCRLFELDLVGTNLTAPSFPTEIFTCPKMGFLRLSGVDMSGGSIPTEIVTLTLLVELRLAASNLSGSIPSEIGALTDLGNLDLSNNRFTGQLPSQIGDLKRLRNLYLEGLTVNGPLPDAWASLALSQFSVQNSAALSGLIPGWVALIDGLVDLRGTNFVTTCNTAPWVDLVPGPSGNPLYGNTVIYVSGNTRICAVCPLPRPLPEAACIKGTWTVPNNVTLPDGARVNVTSPIVIIGSFTQDDTNTIAVTVSGAIPGVFINVTGTATIGGVLEVILTQLSPGQSTVEVLSALQVSGNFTQVRVIDNTGGACRATGEATVTATSVIVLLDASACGPGTGKHSVKRKYIIVGAVMGFLVLGVVVAAVLWLLHRHMKARSLFKSETTEKAWLT